MVPTETEVKLLFDDAGGALRASGGVLRLRRLSRGGVLTFKGPRRLVDGLKTRDEIETAVADPDALQLLLERLQFRRVFRYQKYRETWSFLGQEVVVDETPIGDFLEIEGDAQGIHRAAAALGTCSGSTDPLWRRTRSTAPRSAKCCRRHSACPVSRRRR